MKEENVAQQKGRSPSEMKMAVTQSDDNGDRNSPKMTGRAAWVMVIALVIWIAFLITMILWKGSEIGTPASEQSALIAANERLLQMAQWAIATVLTLGGALIGLNWYQSEKRYEHDRQLFEVRLRAELEEKLGDYEARFQMLSRASIMALDAEAARVIKESIGPRDGTVNDLGFVDRLTSAFDSYSDTLRRRGAGRVLIEELARAGSPVPGKPGSLSAEQLDRFGEIADTLETDAPDLAQQLQATIKAYGWWHFTGDDDHPEEQD